MKADWCEGRLHVGVNLWKTYKTHSCCFLDRSDCFHSAVRGTGEQSNLLAVNAFTEALFRSVALASDAATMIASSSEQQLAVVSQVSYAMSDIESAMQGTLGATTELESSAEQLKTMGGVLKNLIERYRM